MGGELTLSWLPAGETGQQALPLPAGPFAGALHFFIPPGNGEIEQFSLSTSEVADPLVVSDITVDNLH
jgi:hypothetical protein